MTNINPIWKLRNKEIKVICIGGTYRLVIEWDKKLTLIHTHSFPMSEVLRAEALATTIKERGVINTNPEAKCWYKKWNGSDKNPQLRLDLRRA
jgi:hypothetical protein